MKKHKHLSLLAFVLIFALLVPMFSGLVFATEGTELTFVETDSAALADSALADGSVDAAVPEEESEYAQTDTVRIFVALSQPSAIEAGYSTKNVLRNTQAMEYMDNLKEVQTEVAQDITDNLITDGTFQTRGNLTLIANAFTATAQYGDLDELETYLADTYGEAFAGLYIVPQYEVMENDGDTAEPNTLSATGMVGAQNAWDYGYTGAGTRIAIIDTGLDEDHPSFDPDAYLYSLNLTAIENGKQISDYDLLTVDEIAEALPKLHAYEAFEAKGKTLTAEDLYRNAKLAFGFNYIDEDLDITHDNDTEGDHGTHVSGIATANRYVVKTADNGAVSFVPQENGVVGVAPDAQILTMKVFGKGGGAYADDYMNAIEDAIVLNCDAVNLSLGSSVPGRSYAGVAYMDAIMDNLVNTDTVISFSAGNNGYWSESSYADGQGLNYAEDVSMQTGGASGSYTNSFTVASAVNTTITGFGGTFEGVGVVVNDGSSANNAPWGSLDTTEDASGTDLEYVFLGNPDDAEDETKYGAPEAYEGLDVAGKVVLISRGNLTFAEKHAAAQAAGAVACVIYNNVGGTINMTLAGSTATIPCASIQLSEAQEIFAASSEGEDGLFGGTVNVKGKVFTQDNADGYTMSDFSSWGTTGNLAIKPEITAPGGNIYSSVDGGYGINSGTSMAAPSIAGQSALVAQYVAENGLAEKTGLTQRALVQSLLMSTATPLTDPESELPYSVRHQGAGLANAGKAVKSPAYIIMDASATASYADGKVKAELGDDAEKTGVYSFSFNINNLTDEELTYYSGVDVLTPAIVTLEGDEYMSTQETRLNPTVTVTAEGSKVDYLYDLNADGTVDQLDAQVLSDFVAGIGTLTQEQQSAADFNEDGVVDSADVYVLLTKLADGDADVASSKILVDANGSTKLTVTITLSDEDRQYFADNDPNGGYVEGYVRLSGNNDLTVPFLAFYGNFTDASMFDRTGYLESYYGLDNNNSYVSAENRVNFLTQRLSGSTSIYYYGFNLFATEDTFSPEQNYVLSAVNGNSLYQAAPSIIRTTGRMKTSITNAETGEVYWSAYSAPSAAYYYSAASAWQSTYSSVRLGTTTRGWLGTDAEGNPLPDGTVVNVTCTAAPELYTYIDEEDGQRYIREEDLGEGAYWTTTVTIDNTAPTIHSVYYSDDLWGSNDYLTIDVEDNRNVAAIILFNSTGNTALTRTAVEQSSVGERSTVRLDIGDVEGSKFVLAAVDYAGNITAGEISLSTAGREDVETPDEEPDTNVYAVVQDANNALAWSTVDVTAATATKVSDISVPLENAVYYGGKIYGNAGGALYELDGTSLAALSGLQLNATYNFSDIGIAPSFDKLMLAAGQRLCLMTPGDTGLSYFNLASLLGEETLTGVTYMFTGAYNGADADYLAAVTNTGNFYVFLVYATDTGFGLSYATYGSIQVNAAEDLHSQGLMFNRNDGYLYYTVGATIYRIGLKTSGTTTVVDPRLIGTIPNVKMASAMLLKQDGVVSTSAASDTQWTSVPFETTEIQAVPDSLD